MRVAILVEDREIDGRREFFDEIQLAGDLQEEIMFMLESVNSDTERKQGVKVTKQLFVVNE